MPPLNYRNLLQNRCPKCNKNLWFDENEEMLLCSIRCGFMIHKAKMESICIGMVGKKIENSTLFDEL